MKAIVNYLRQRPGRSIAGALLIVAGLVSGLSGMGVILAAVGAIVLAD